MQPVYFEDLKIGMEFRSDISEPFTQKMVEAFANLTGDRAHTPTIQGNLIVARSGGLLFEVGHFNETLIAQAEKNTRFVKSLHIGEQIYVIEKVVELEDRENKPYGRVVLSRMTYNKDDECILETRQDYRIKKRS